MARYIFQLTPVTPGAYVRLDSASGSTSPTAVSPIDSAYVFPGAVLRSDASTGALGRVAAGVATLYQKTLNASGSVTATATLTGTLVDGPGPGALETLTFPIPVNSGDSGTFAQVLPAVSSYTYNADGSIATETVAGLTTSFTYNADGSIATMTRSGVTRTFSYNADGSLAGVA